MDQTDIAVSYTDEDYSRETFSDEAAKRKAEMLGCDIMYSTDQTLLLDLDMSRSKAEDLVMDRIRLLNDLGFGYVWDILESRSGRSHAVITLSRPLPIDQRIALQAMLGSDWKREMLSLAGLRAGQQNPVLLFRPRPAPPASWQEDLGDII